MGFLKKFSELKESVIHDAASLERYVSEVGKGEKLSVLCFYNNSEMESAMLADILYKASRKSDLVFHEHEKFVILMPATDKEGAKHTFEEMDSSCKDLKNVKILVFPDDALSPDVFYEEVHKTLSQMS